MTRLAEPTTDDAVAAALVAARADGLRVRVCGAGRPAPDAGAEPGVLTLSTAALRGVVDLRPFDLVVTVRAGTPLAELEASLDAAGCELPVRPWDREGRGTIAGAVAAGADGLTARNGWTWRDVVLGATVALPSGEVVRVGASVVKSVAGFDVPKVLCGSRGRLGVITCLHLRIDTRPPSTGWARIGPVRGNSVADLVALVDALPSAPRGLVVTAVGPLDACVLDAVFTGPAEAVRSSTDALRRHGFETGGPADPRTRFAHWSDLVRRAAAPPPGGLHRRHAPLGRGAAVARSGAQLAGDWIGDVLRGRCTWLDCAPQPAGDAAARRLHDRVRAAFDPGRVMLAAATEDGPDGGSAA